MSIATNKLREEIKELLCRLLNIPNDGRAKDIEILIEKILLCATLETHSRIQQIPREFRS